MDYMDEYDPDWAGDPKISTLKRMAFDAQRDIIQLKDYLAKEIGNRIIASTIARLIDSVKRLDRENSISNLYFQDKISREEAKRLWDLYKSPDEENHRVAEAAIEELTKKN
jgi:hypothetical protein